jgi:hypothetical protein
LPVLASRRHASPRVGCRRLFAHNGDVDEFDRLAAMLDDRDGVAVAGGRGFGAGTLQVGGRIFAMRNDAGLALKLPAGRVAELLTSGEGLPFDAGKGRPMREWVVIPGGAEDRWPALAEEALAFVGAARPA